MIALSLENICKSFGQVAVLKDISLTVNDGEFIVFVGPSGCGKSTLLRSIAGLEDVTSGTIRIGSDDVTNTPPAKRGIAMVFQSYALYPHLDVEGNMALGLKQAGESKQAIAERIDKASRMLSLEKYLKRRPSELSGGQRQRVAIGRAIVRQPKLFLFDEPLSNLDAALRMATRVEIARLHRQLGAAMIYVTHDQTEAMTLADRIVVLRDGHIEQVGSPMELYNNPANQFVAGFLGAPSMNFVAAGPLGLRGEMLGIRPEQLEVKQGGQVSGSVTHIERLGGDTNLLVITPAGELVTVRLFGQHDYAVDAPISLGFDPRHAYYFDSAGQRIRD
ncbi:MAG: ABC transporter ATP-binding protein [Paracoccaceae bacterium]